MRWSKSFIPTLREQPKNVESVSHALCIRAGLIKPLMSGVYSYLPLGWRVLSKIMGIIREEINCIGGQELALPSLSPGELWEKTGRWSEWGQEMFKFKDRKNRDLCLAPTHEEIITDIVSKELRSYKDLPQIWYQIRIKYRDEPRPRGGVLRMREFIMKDSYSMDVDEEGAKRSYELHRSAYSRIFERCGLRFELIEAPSGVMGGGLSEEFMVPTEGGEDSIIVCKNCGYKSSREIATKRKEMKEVQPQDERKEMRGEIKELQKVWTPVEGTVDKISDFLGVQKNKLMKSLLFFHGKEPLFILIRGDHEVSMEKLVRRVGDIRIAEPSEIRTLTGAEAGYISPIGLSIRTLADFSLRGAKGLVTGANEDAYHWTGVDIERDLRIDEWLDIEVPNPGDPCPNCDSSLSLEQAIEVGHIFRLGTRYSEPMGAYYLDSEGKRRPIVMGSYGIGIERVMAAVIETHNDSDGIIWPEQIAPYKVVIIPLNNENPVIKEIAEQTYRELSNQLHTDIIIDDRNESPGVKFKDAMLIGIPWQIVIGERSINKGYLEIKTRNGKISKTVKKEKVVEELLSLKCIS